MNEDSVWAAWFPTWFRWLLWGGYFAAWTTALLLPHPVSDNTYSHLPTDPFYLAKALHVVGYMGGTILTAWLLISRKGRWLLLGVIFFHGIATEFLQQFVPPRTPSVRDVVLDHLGIVLGVAVTWKWWRMGEQTR